MNDKNHGKLEREALELPRDVEPPRDLWAGIGARIEARRRRATVVRRSIAGATVLLAAAGVVLSVRFGGQQPFANRAPAPIASEPLHAVAPSKGNEEPAADGVVPEEASYLAALSSLESTFHEREKDLPPKTAIALAVSLHALDTAIAVTRASLVERPDDADLRSELDAEYEQKIDTMNDVLEWTTRS